MGRSVARKAWEEGGVRALEYSWPLHPCCAVMAGFQVNRGNAGTLGRKFLPRVGIGSLDQQLSQSRQFPLRPPVPPRPTAHLTRSPGWLAVLLTLPGPPFPVTQSSGPCSIQSQTWPRHRTRASRPLQPPRAPPSRLFLSAVPRPGSPLPPPALPGRLSHFFVPTGRGVSRESRASLGAPETVRFDRGWPGAQIGAGRGRGRGLGKGGICVNRPHQEIVLVCECTTLSVLKLKIRTVPVPGDVPHVLYIFPPSVR